MLAELLPAPDDARDAPVALALSRSGPTRREHHNDTIINTTSPRRLVLFAAVSVSTTAYLRILTNVA